MLSTISKPCTQKRDDSNKYNDIGNIDRETSNIEITTAFIFIDENNVAFNKVHVKHCCVIDSLKN